MLMAEATFEETGKYGISGFVAFSQPPWTNYVRVDINLHKVPMGIHGIHIHKNPIKMKDFCMQMDMHFNGTLPTWSPNCLHGIQHGSFSKNTERHIGDLCNNIMSDSNETVMVSFYDPLISLDPESPNCIVGRSVIIHEDWDDEGIYYRRKSRKTESKMTGNSGKCLAHANILAI